MLPQVFPTAGSPLQYGYRTKLTPHFEIRGQGKNKAGKGDEGSSSAPPAVNIGFAQMGRRQVMDIEVCILHHYSAH